MFGTVFCEFSDSLFLALHPTSNSEFANAITEGMCVFAY